MLYDPRLLQPMRAELTRLGVRELRTSDEVDEVLGAGGDTLVVVNSVCGCAARNGAARRGDRHASRRCSPNGWSRSSQVRMWRRRPARGSILPASARHRHRSRFFPAASCSSCSSGTRSRDEKRTRSPPTSRRRTTNSARPTEFVSSGEIRGLPGFRDFFPEDSHSVVTSLGLAPGRRSLRVHGVRRPPARAA